MITGKDVQAMAEDAIVFALANPDPEIDPVIAKHATVVPPAAVTIRIRSTSCWPSPVFSADSWMLALTESPTRP